MAEDLTTLTDEEVANRWRYNRERVVVEELIRRLHARGTRATCQHCKHVNAPASHDWECDKLDIVLDGTPHEFGCTLYAPQEPR